MSVKLKRTFLGVCFVMIPGRGFVQLIPWLFVRTCDKPVELRISKKVLIIHDNASVLMFLSGVVVNSEDFKVGSEDPRGVLDGLPGGSQQN